MIKRRQLLVLPLSLAAFPAVAREDLWDAIREGKAVALLRHAQAPGTGDPVNFRIGDCATQRNLSPEGRDRAQRLGQLFRANRIAEARVYSSQWCRCLDTAALLGLGPVKELPILNSFFDNASKGPAQTRDLVAWLQMQNSTQPIVLVTHQVNITRLTGIVPSQGEVVVATRRSEGDLEVLGRLRG